MNPHSCRDFHSGETQSQILSNYGLIILQSFLILLIVEVDRIIAGKKWWKKQFNFIPSLFYWLFCSPKEKGASLLSSGSLIARSSDMTWKIAGIFPVNKILWGFFITKSSFRRWEARKINKSTFPASFTAQNRLSSFSPCYLIISNSGTWKNSLCIGWKDGNLISELCSQRQANDWEFRSLFVVSTAT